jgi:hypothetical protein
LKGKNKESYFMGSLKIKRSVKMGDAAEKKYVARG